MHTFMWQFTIICIYNFTVVQVLITNFPRWGNHGTLSQKWLGSTLSFFPPLGYINYTSLAAS